MNGYEEQRTAQEILNSNPQVESLRLQIAVLGTSAEGIFRYLYTTCTQQVLAANIKLAVELAEEGLRKVRQVQDLAMEIDNLKALAMVEATRSINYQQEEKGRMQ